MDKKYGSFKELNRDLRILSLEKDISIWTLKNSYKGMQRSFTLSRFFLGVINRFSSKRNKGNKVNFLLKNLFVGYLLRRLK